MRSSSPSTLKSVPAYCEYRTRSPFLTSIFSRVPSSRVFPGPTARMVPSCGFSLAVSGRTIPLLVTSSRALGLMTTRSPRGLSLLLLTVALANAQFLLRAASLRLPSLLLDVVCSTPAGRRVRSRPSAGTSPARARESLAHCLGRTRRGCSAVAAAAPDRPISTLPLRVLTDYRRRYGMSSVRGVARAAAVAPPLALDGVAKRGLDAAMRSGRHACDGLRGGARLTWLVRELPGDHG